MGHPDGAHTHGHGGGSGIGTAVLVVLGAVVVASIAGPVVHAAAELLRVVVIVAAVLVGVAVVGLAALVAWRLRRRRQNTPLVVRQVPPVTHRPAESLLAPRRSVAALPAPERPAEIHLHLHGVAAEDVAAILRQHEDGSRAP